MVTSYLIVCLLQAHFVEFLLLVYFILCLFKETSHFNTEQHAKHFADFMHFFGKKYENFAYFVSRLAKNMLNQYAIKLRGILSAGSKMVFTFP